MTELARLAGSVLCVGLPGGELDDDARRDLEALQPGGIVLFARNATTFEAARATVAAARAVGTGAAPPLVCVDQEGGRVMRLRFGEFAVPSAMALGAAGDEALAERAGAQLAGDVLAIGANVDFAPVLDLALEARNTVVGTRAFGDDPQRVASLGAAVVRGIEQCGVVATVKHFPGHGSTALDSHTALPVVDAGLATLRERDFVPFRALIAGGVRAVMTAHVIVRALDPASPATLSRRVLTDLLRGEFGFDGVCFTDCLQMDAIARGVGTARGAVLALAAGADAVVVSHDLPLALEVRKSLEQAVGTGDLPRARLEEAARRVGRLRASVPEAHVRAPVDVALEVARRAVTLVRGSALLAPERAVTVVSFEGDPSDGVAAAAARRPSLSFALRRRRVRSEVMRVPLEPTGAMLEALLEVVRAQGNRNVVVIARRAHLHPAQQRAVAALFEIAPDAVAVSALEPFDVPLFARAHNVVCTFGDEETNVDALADVLTGRRAATGRLPVVLATNSVG